MWNATIHAAFQCIFYRFYSCRNDQNACMISKHFLHELRLLLRHSLISDFKVKRQTKYVTALIPWWYTKKDKPNISVSSRIANRFILDFLPVSSERNVRSLGRIGSPRVPLFKYQSWSTANIGERSFLMVQHYFHERPKCDWLWRMYLFQKQTVWIKTFFFHLLFCYFMNLRHLVLRMEVGMKSK